MRADLLERAGEARWGADNAPGAVETWVTAANVAREHGYDERLRSVLERLRDICARGGRDDVAQRYREELDEVKARLGAGGGARP
jgi:hypothetical protein